MTGLRYVSHPEVVVDPEVPVPRWPLDEVGRARAEALAATTWASGLRRVISSPETKAVETAGMLAEAAGVEVEIRPATGEIDRSSTGYLPPR